MAPKKDQKVFRKIKPGLDSWSIGKITLNKQLARSALSFKVDYPLFMKKPSTLKLKKSGVYLLQLN
jgi:hypothetical protein